MAKRIINRSDLLMMGGTLLLGAGLLLFGPQVSVESSVETEYLEGRVTEVKEEGSLELELDSERIEAVAGFDGESYEEGDLVVVSVYEDPLTGTETYIVNDSVRRPAIFAAVALFLVVVLAVAGWQGIRALLGLAFSFVVLVTLILPLLLSQVLPFVAILLGALLILPILFYLSHGVSRKTTVAMAGTLLTLVVTTGLIWLFTDWAHLTGTSSEEASFLMLGALGERIDFKVILLTGILLSLIGVLDDVCVSQASVVQELKAQHKKELFKSAMRVGRDHIASLVNTLILVYAGASLPLILLFFEYQQPLTQIMNFEFMAEEILRTLLASVGLVLAVPITSFLAIQFLSGDHTASDDGGYCRFHHK